MQHFFQYLYNFVKIYVILCLIFFLEVINMNFNKCSRCGCFFMNSSSVCPNCAPKDELEMNRLKNFIEENSSENYTIDAIISSTGSSAKNLNRFLEQKQFTNFATQIQNENMTRT